MSASLSIRKGSIYLPVEVCDTYFRGLDAVIVLIREGALNILPVQQMRAGGYLLKIRNSSGDRVVSAPDVFFEHDLCDWEAADLSAAWSSESGALICPLELEQT